MKTKNPLFYLAFFGIIFLVVNCNQPLTPVDDTFESMDQSLKSKTSKVLPADVAAGVQFMREEEKLAHDVYLYLNDLFPHRVFQNIMKSEQSHTDAVLRLIVFYDLVDPAAGLDPGVFYNSDLQDLYDNLIDLGNGSLNEALVVGCIIEETDIIDIVRYIEEAGDIKNVIQVYSNLLEGSKNHLRAFVEVLKTRGLDYVPQYISQEEFDAIING